MIKLSIKIIILIIIVEAVSRILVDYIVPPYWYEEAAIDIKHKNIKYIFIGSSRVACSIDASEFISTLCDSKKSNVIAINMGRGYSTLQEHYLGIKKISTSKPDALKNVVVLFEAPNGTPMLGNWKSKWAMDNYQELLSNSMAIEDLSDYWITSNDTVTDKAYITLTKLFHTYKLIDTTDKIANIVIKPKTSQAVASNILPKINSSGGVVNANLDDARNLAISLANKTLENQREYNASKFDESVLASLNKLIIAKGGKLILFNMPMCSVQKKIDMSLIGSKNKFVITNLALNNGITILNTDIKTTDDDFPDYWHLRDSRRDEYSRKLANAYLIAVEKKFTHQIKN